MRKLLLLLLFPLLGLTAQATHMSGGEIYWECIGPNQYRITMVIYRDCFGINVDPTYTLQVQSPCGNTSLVVSTPGGVEISQLCDLELPNSTCNGGNLPGIQQYIYTGIITLPPCNFYTISYTNIYRNAAIVNLTNPGAQRTYIRATINTAAAPCNDSPQFTNTAIPYVCMGYPITYSFGAFDPESDSLSYEFIPAMGIAGAPLNYVNPHSGAQPIPGITLNPVTGEVNFTLNQMGNWVVAVRVNHWVNGVIVGTVMRDMQFVAYPCDNIPPDPATGVVAALDGTATQTGPRSIELCASGDFCFDMVISDPNPGNVLTAFSNVAQNLPGATFSYTGTNPITATVCWVAAQGSAGFYPFIVNVNDGACPIPAFQTYIYSVRVLPGLYATLEVVDESCLGDNDGSLTVNVTDGNAPFSYTWSTGSSEPSITGGPGDYTVEVEDSNGCISDVITGTIGTIGLPNEANAGTGSYGCVNVPLALQGTVVNATGGEWSGGSGTFGGTWPNIMYAPSEADLLAGGAMLTLTTTGNPTCPPATDEIFIALVDNFTTTTVSAIDATCYNTANGSATVSGAPFGATFQWNDPAGQGTATATSLSAGSYTVVVTDTLGCSITLQTIVGPQDPITVTSITGTDEGCQGDGDGSATVMVEGGTAPYTYAWSNGGVTPTIVVGSGTWEVSVTDANGCAPAIADVTIAAQGLPNVADAGDGLVGCLYSAVALNGAVTNATGGTWSGGSGTFAGTGLNASYLPSPAEVQAGSVELLLTTTGNTVCPPATDVLLITLSNSFLQAAVSSVDATCSDNANGSATFTPQAAGMSYLWNDPAAQTTATASGLAPGTYEVTVTDVLGCDTTMSAFIGPQDAIAIASLTAQDENCLGSGDGSATVTATGGTAPYTYIWSNNATTPTITVGSGDYSVSVTDANNCTAALGSITVGALGLPNVADAGNDVVGCMGALPVVLNGNVTNATSGTWSGGNGTFAGSWPNITYMPSTTDVQNGSVELSLVTVGNTTCPPATDVMTITLPNSFAGASVNGTDALCNAAADGIATFSPAQPGFTYLWNDAAAQTGATATGLVAGNYSVVVNDAFGCDTTLGVTIGEPEMLVIADLAVTNETCAGYGNGSITVTPNGGTAPYTYAWSHGPTSAIINVEAGSWTVVVSDANGCATAPGTATVNANGQPNAAFAGPNLVGCLNALPVELNGTVTSAPGGAWSGGSGFLVGTWPNVVYHPSVAEIQNGSVQLFLTTVGNTSCPPASDTLEIALSNAFLNPTLSTTGPSCHGFSDGTIAFAPGNTGNTYLWNDPMGQTTATATGLPIGTWTVTVTDVLGCDTTLSATLVQPAPLAVATVNAIPALCNGQSNGSAAVTLTGGTPNYTVTWNNGMMGATVNGLGAGTYAATITDAQGCSTQATAVIGEPNAILLTAQAPDTVCVNTAVDLSANASGGTGALQVNWGGLGTGTTIQAFFQTSQNVVVTVVDAVGCSGPLLTLPITVLNLNSASLLTYGDTTVCPGGSASVGATVLNYPGTYTLGWPQLGAVGAGPFNVPITADIDVLVTATDVCNNTLNGLIPLRLDVPPALNLPPVIAEGCAPLTVQLPGSAPISGYTYLWDLGNGNSSSAVAPSVVYNAGNFIVTLTVTTTLGCTATGNISGTVIAHQPPTIDFTATPWVTDIANSTIQFQSQGTGSITLHEWTFGDGGTAYTANPGHTYLDVGTFPVELYVEDVNGCTASAEHNVVIGPVHDVVVPTAFTPNPNGGNGGTWVPGDLSNDVFYPFAEHVEKFRMRIFNRWGELVFESDELGRGWDGYYRDQLSPQDVYVVQTWVRFVDGKEVQKLSDLTLFR